MKHTYTGNIESLKAKVEYINSLRGIPFFSYRIFKGKLTENKLFLEGTFAKAIATFTEMGNETELNLKVKAKWQLWLPFFLLMILALGFLFHDKVTIQGDSDPTILKRIIAASFPLILALANLLFIRRVEKYFKNKFLDTFE